MKKRLAMSLAAVMLLLSACGGTPSSGQSSSVSSSEQTDTSVSSPAPAQSAGGSVVQFDPTAHHRGDSAGG